jgi:hypothetical protein
MSYNFYIEGSNFPTLKEVREILESNGFIIERYEVSQALNYYNKKHDDVMFFTAIKDDKELNIKTIIIIDSEKKHKNRVVIRYTVYKGSYALELDRELIYRGYKTFNH